MAEGMVVCPLLFLGWANGIMGFAIDRDGKIVKLPPVNNREDALASAQQMLESEEKAIESGGGKRKRVVTPLVGTDYGYFNIGKLPCYISWYDIGNGVMEKMYHRHRRAALLHANSKFSENNNTTVRQLWGFYTPTLNVTSYRAWWYSLEGFQKTHSGFKDQRDSLNFAYDRFEELVSCDLVKEPCTGLVHYGSVLQKGGVYQCWVKGFNGVKISQAGSPTFPTSEMAIAHGKKIHETAMEKWKGSYVRQLSPL